MDDLFNLERFVTAQNADYLLACKEITQGLKRSHWMWYIFPQISGLGFTDKSRFYAIKSKDEAIAYLKHEILGARLLEITGVVLNLQGLSAIDVFGELDALKLRSCVTLFREISPANTVFSGVLDKYFDGKPDIKTLQILKRSEITN